MILLWFVRSGVVIGQMPDMLIVQMFSVEELIAPEFGEDELTAREFSVEELQGDWA